MKPYEELYELVGTYVRRLAAGPALIADVTQDVLLKIHHSIGTLHDQEKLVPWLQRIVYTTLHDHYRAHHRFRSLPPPEPPAEASSEGNEAVADCLLLLLHLLPPAQRELLEAVELRGVSQTAYAAAHHLPLSTVKSRVQRARHHLRAQITGNCQLTTDAYGNVVDFAKPEKKQLNS